MGSKQPTRIVLLKNYLPTSPVDQAMTESFRSKITDSIPDAQIDIRCTAGGDAIPDPAAYNLVILSGGPVNLLDNDQPQWVLDVLGLIRQVADEVSSTKMLGICWGYQAVHLALGGQLDWIGEKHRVRLLSVGRSFMRNSI